MMLPLLALPLTFAISTGQVVPEAAPVPVLGTVTEVPATEAPATGPTPEPIAESGPPPSPKPPVVRRTGTGAALAAVQAQLSAQEARLIDLEARLTTLEAVPPPPPPAAEDAGKVGRRLQSFGRTLVVPEGERVAEAIAFGAPVDVAGSVVGDVVSFGGDVDVRSTGRVEGDAVSFGGEVRLEGGGEVLGDRTGIAEVPISFGPSAVASYVARGGSWAQGQVRRLVLLLSLAATSVLVLGIAPDQVQGVARGLREHPVRYGFTGFLLSIAVVFVAALLAVTLIGIPVSLVLLGAAAFAWLLGFTGLALATGTLLPLPSSGGGKLVALLLGIVLIALVGLVPWVGKIALVLMVFPALGAAVGTRFGTRA